MASIAKRFLIVGLILVSLFGSETVWAKKGQTNIVFRKWVVKLKQNSFWNRRPFQFASPAVAEDKVFVGVHRDLFYAVDAKRGKKLWKFNTQGPVHAQARVQDNIVYFADMEGIAYGLDGASGKAKWMTRVGAPVMSAPLVLADRVYVSSLDKTLTCLDRKTGNIFWQVNFGNRDSGFTIKGSSNPTLFGEMILIGYSDGMILAHRLTDGQIVWAKQFGDPFAEFHDVDGEVQFSVPQLIADSETKAYVTSADGQLFAFHPQTGAIFWQAPVGSVNDVALADPYIYVAARGIVYCLQKETGQVLWEQDLDTAEISSPVIYRDWLAVVATKGRIFFLDRNSGDILYRWYVRGGSYADPVAAGNRLYLLSNAGKLYAFQFR